MLAQLLSLLAHKMDHTTIHQEGVGCGMFQAVRCAASSLFLLAVAGNAAAQSSNYQVVSLNNPGTIAGAVKWSGPLPRIPTFSINKDPEICDPESHKIRDLERLIIGPQGGVANTVVYLKNISRGKAINLPEPRRFLDQKRCRYEPHILLVPQDAELRMKWMAQPRTICLSPSPTRSFPVACRPLVWPT